MNVPRISSSIPTQTSEEKRTIEVDNQEKVTEESTDSDTNQDTPIDTKHKTAVNSVTSPTMDVITIIWYFSTFIALVAFFVVMVCSDKYCTRVLAKPEETVISAPATPAPSYREFAPPSYESVMKKYKSRVFIIPMLNESGELKVPDDQPQQQLPPPPPPATTSVVIDVEVQKPTVHPQSEEISQCKNAALVAESQQVKSTPREDGPPLMVVVVINENGDSKNCSESDANESR